MRIETYINKIIKIHVTDHSVKYRIDGNAIVTTSIYSKESVSDNYTRCHYFRWHYCWITATLIDSGYSNYDPNYERDESSVVLRDYEEIYFEEIVTTAEKLPLLISFQ